VSAKKENGYNLSTESFSIMMLTTPLAQGSINSSDIALGMKVVSFCNSMFN
jgi:hypothetical protein